MNVLDLFSLFTKQSFYKMTSKMNIHLSGYCSHPSIEK